MSLLKGVEQVPDFPNGAELSAAALNVLQRNIYLCDAASRYGRIAHCAAYGEPHENDAQNPNLLWRGGFVFVTGATTLTIVTYTTGQQSGDQLQVMRGGVVSDYFALANGVQTHTVTISGAGYAHKEVVEVKIYAYHSSAPADRDWGNFEIRDAYISPIGLSDPWPGFPAPFGAITESNLDLLSNGVGWLVRKIGLRVEPLFQAVIRKEGPFAGQTTVRWTGSITRSAGHPTIRALVRIQQKSAGTTERVRLKVNGTIVDFYDVPATPGEYTDVLAYNASGVAAGTLLWLEIDMIKTAPVDLPPLSDPDTSRITIYRVWAEPEAGAIAHEADFAPRVAMPFGPSGVEGTLQTRLNRLRNYAAAIKSRLDSNTHIWDRQQLYRARYAAEAPGEFQQFEAFEPASVAFTMQRLGQAVMLRGKGVSIAYGPGRFLEEFNDVGAQAWENFKNEPAIDADEVAAERVYLDSLPGLPPFAPYAIRGVDLYYAGEEIQVEEL